VLYQAYVASRGSTLLAFESVASTFNAKRGSASFSANCESRSDGDEDGDFTSRTAREDVVPAVTR
jgi:hypothetical protein